MLRPITALPIALVAGLLTVGCGPVLSTQTRLETVPAPDNKGMLSKDGLVVSVPNLKEMPAQLKANFAVCNGNAALVDSAGNPIVKEVALAPVGADVYQVKIANQTDHVIRLQGAVIRLFDPAENQIEPMSKEDLVASTMNGLVSRGVCAHEAMKVQAAFATVRIIGPNTEVLPGTTTTGFVIFLTPKVDLSGVWKLSFYEVPVKVDGTGAAVTKARFDFAYLRTKYRDTFSQEFMGERKLVKTEEAP